MGSVQGTYTGGVYQAPTQQSHRADTHSTGAGQREQAQEHRHRAYTDTLQERRKNKRVHKSTS